MWETTVMTITTCVFICYGNIKCVNTIRSEKLREQEDTEQKKNKNNCHNKKYKRTKQER